MVSLSIILLSLLIVGSVSKLLEYEMLGILFPLSILLIAFVWMPMFLFYAYDRKQQRKNQSGQEE